MKKFALIALAAALSLNAHAGEGQKVDLPAPEITGINQNGAPVNFAEVYKKGITVVYFYPKANTPGCTKQSCSLRDAYADLTKRGVQVLGVSTDTPEAQKKFIADFTLPFDLIADPEGKVLEAFKVSKMLGMNLATRQCFIIKGGRIVWHDDKAATAKQAEDIDRVLKELGV
ncbi:MAG: peroxiredoxin [Verrucomicrobiaceae bacterium]|nr:peroxiredoxin [Verrucomicrobiaceae bacterium]